MIAMMGREAAKGMRCVQHAGDWQGALPLTTTTRAALRCAACSTTLFQARARASLTSQQEAASVWAAHPSLPHVR